MNTLEKCILNDLGGLGGGFLNFRKKRIKIGLEAFMMLDSIPKADREYVRENHGKEGYKPVYLLFGIPLTIKKKMRGYLVLDVKDAK